MRKHVCKGKHIIYIERYLRHVGCRQVVGRGKRGKAWCVCAHVVGKAKVREAM